MNRAPPVRPYRLVAEGFDSMIFVQHHVPRARSLTGRVGARKASEYQHSRTDRVMRAGRYRSAVPTTEEVLL